MTKVTVSFEFESGGSNNAELIARIAGLLAGLENPVTLQEPVAVAKVRKPRKTKTWTDTEKAAFHAKMVAGRAKKATAKAKPVEPVKSVKLSKADLAKLVPSAAVSAKAPAMPSKGHKVPQAPAAE